MVRMRMMTRIIWTMDPTRGSVKSPIFCTIPSKRLQPSKGRWPRRTDSFWGSLRYYEHFGVRYRESCNMHALRHGRKPRDHSTRTRAHACTLTVSVVLGKSGRNIEGFLSKLYYTPCWSYFQQLKYVSTVRWFSSRHWYDVVVVVVVVDTTISFHVQIALLTVQYTNYSSSSLLTLKHTFTPPSLLASGDALYTVADCLEAVNHTVHMVGACVYVCVGVRVYLSFFVHALEYVCGCMCVRVRMCMHKVISGVKLWISLFVCFPFHSMKSSHKFPLIDLCWWEAKMEILYQ